jgi:hypothetical protein
MRRDLPAQAPGRRGQDCASTIRPDKGGKGRTFRKKYITTPERGHHDVRTTRCDRDKSFFYETFADKHVTYFDVVGRKSLDGHVGQSFVRFFAVQTPRPTARSTMGPRHISVAINLDPELEPGHQRSLKRGLPSSNGSASSSAGMES